MVPKENEPWEIIVVNDSDTDHGLFPYGEEVFRTMVRPETGAHMEVLAYYFPVVGPEEGRSASTGVPRSFRSGSRSDARISLADPPERDQPRAASGLATD